MCNTPRSQLHFLRGLRCTAKMMVCKIAEYRPKLQEQRLSEHVLPSKRCRRAKGCDDGQSFNSTPAKTLHVMWTLSLSAHNTLLERYWLMIYRLTTKVDIVAINTVFQFSTRFRAQLTRVEPNAQANSKAACATCPAPC